MAAHLRRKSSGISCISVSWLETGELLNAPLMILGTWFWTVPSIRFGISVAASYTTLAYSWFYLIKNLYSVKSDLLSEPYAMRVKTLRVLRQLKHLSQLPEVRRVYKSTVRHQTQNACLVHYIYFLASNFQNRVFKDSP